MPPRAIPELYANSTAHHSVDQHVTRSRHRISALTSPGSRCAEARICLDQGKRARYAFADALGRSRVFVGDGCKRCDVGLGGSPGPFKPLACGLGHASRLSPSAPGVVPRRSEASRRRAFARRPGGFRGFPIRRARSRRARRSAACQPASVQLRGRAFPGAAAERVRERVASRNQSSTPLRSDP